MGLGFSTPMIGDFVTSYARHIALVAFCLGAASTPLAAQPCGTVIPGPSQGLGARTTADGSLRLSMRAEDRALIERTLTAVDQLVRKTVYGTPRGYYAFTQFTYNAPSSRTRLSEYEFAYVIFCPTRAIAVDGSNGGQVVFNPNPQWWSESDRPMIDEHGGQIFTERIRKPTQLGATLTFGDVGDDPNAGFRLLFTTGDESPTLPVTREEYLRAQIFTIERSGPKKSEYRE